MNIRYDAAFGIIPVFVDVSCVFEYLLIRHVKGHWAFPKGHATHNEQTTKTALREFHEETGIAPIQIHLLETTSFVEEYSYTMDNEIVRKTVTYFIGLMHGKQQVQLQPEEVDEYQWCSAEHALDLITFHETKHLFSRVHTHLISLPKNAILSLLF